jgi:hypothetical protein
VTKFRWTGPFRIRDLLAKCILEGTRRPPERDAIYLVSQRAWRRAPSARCVPLYFGGNTGRSPRFRTRIGDLIADMHGFYCDSTGHHSGGQSVFKWCQETNVSPGDLFLGWAVAPSWCSRCAELDLSYQFQKEGVRLLSLLNKVRPPACVLHRGIS